MNTLLPALAIMIATGTLLFPEAAKLNITLRITIFIFFVTFIIMTLISNKFLSKLNKINPFFLKIYKLLVTNPICKVIYILILSIFVVFISNINYLVVISLTFNFIVVLSFIKTSYGLKIIEAKYESPINPSHNITVTKLLNKNIHNGQLIFPVSNEALGKDPEEGTIKRVRIKYSLNGIQKEKEFKEYSIINLP